MAGHAARLRPVLVGETIIGIAGTAPSLRANSRRVLGSTVLGIRTMGKNLVVDLSGGWSIRVHLGMSGRWRVVAGGGAIPGSARLVLSTGSASAVLTAAPTIEVDRTPAIDSRLSRLGPDVLGVFDGEEFVRRARSAADASMSELLLDQRVIAGVGNVYKSELLFLAGIDPHTPVREVSDGQLRGLAAEAVRLMSANVGPKARTTTGSRARDQEMWVYGRAGRPCRRCGSVIAQDRQGDRVTYWCPGCQGG